MTRHILLHASLTALLAGVFLATSTSALLPENSLAATTHIVSSAPHAAVQTLCDALAKAEKITATPRRVAVIGSAVDQAFDLETILRNSIGARRYDALSTDERQKLLDAFRRFTVMRYTSTFKPGTNSVFSVTPAPQSLETGGMVIHTTIRGRQDAPDDATTLNYIMTHTAHGWRITDILLDGHISQVAAQRSDYRTTFTQGGASGLTHMFNQKADEALHE